MKNTITDLAAIRKALCSPASMPDSFLPKELKSIGIAKFKGDNLPDAWSVNKHFVIGEEYPIYKSEGIFAISSIDGKGYKFVNSAWSKIK